MNIKNFEGIGLREYTLEDMPLVKEPRTAQTKAKPAGLTATEDSLLKNGQFLRKTECKAFEVLSCNAGGIMKRNMLGKAISHVLANLKYDGSLEEWAREVVLKTFTGEESPRDCEDGGGMPVLGRRR